MSVLVWLDGPIPTHLATWAAQAAQMCDVAAVWTPKEDAHHLCRWRLGHLVDALRALQAQGLETRLTVWATSHASEWAQQSAWLRDVYELCAVGGVERPGLDLDAEEAWRTTQTLEQIGEFAAQWRLKVAANYVPSLRLSAATLALCRAPWVGEIVPQAYSQWQPAKAWTHDPLIRPRVFQRHALAQAGQIQAGRTTAASVRVGLMAAFQGHPAPHPQGLAALDAAVEECQRTGVGDVALWSAKHLTGDKATWAEGLKARLAQGLT